MSEKIDKIVKDYPWGHVVAAHEIGPYIIVEYHPFLDGTGGKPDVMQREFHPYVRGKDTMVSFCSLEAAMAGGIAFGVEGRGHKADKYFIAALEFMGDLASTL